MKDCAVNGLGFWFKGLARPMKRPWIWYRKYHHRTVSLYQPEFLRRYYRDISYGERMKWRKNFEAKYKVEIKKTLKYYQLFLREVKRLKSLASEAGTPFGYSYPMAPSGKCFVSMAERTILKPESLFEMIEKSYIPVFEDIYLKQAEALSILIYRFSRK